MAASKPIFSAGWKPVKLVYTDSTEETVMLEAGVHEAIQNNDQETIQNIADELGRAYGGKTIASIVVDSNTCGPDKNNNVMVGEKENQEQEDAPSSQQSDIGVRSNDVHTWTHEAVLLLIEQYGENKEKFSSSAYRQKDVWRIIARTMTEMGHEIDHVQCSDKFRALKYRHKVITDSNGKSGRGRRTWAFFEAMEDVMAGDPAVHPVKVVASAEHQDSRGKQPLPTIHVVRKSSHPPPTPSNSRQSHSYIHPPPTPSTSSQISDQYLQPTPSTSRCHTQPQSNQQNQEPRKRRRSNQEPPEWFELFREEQKERFDKLDADNKEFLKIAKERNSLLARLVEHLVDND